MLKLTKMLSLAGTLIVLGTINPAQGAVVSVGDPLVVGLNNNESAVTKITGLQILNSDGSAIDILDVHFQFDAFNTTFGESPSSEAFFLNNEQGAHLALKAITCAINGGNPTPDSSCDMNGVDSIPTNAEPRKVEGMTTMVSFPIPTSTYSVPFELNSNRVTSIVGHSNNSDLEVVTTQTISKHVSPVMYAKFNKIGEIDLTDTTATVPEPSNLASIVVFGASLLFLAKPRPGSNP